MPRHYRNSSASAQRLLTGAWKVPPESAGAVADLFRVLADELGHIDRAHREKITRKETAAARITEFRNSPKLLQRRLLMGDPFRVAVQRVSADLDCPPETIQVHWWRHVKEISKADRGFRDRQIVMLLQAGNSDPEISERVGCSQRTVQRVTSKWKAGWLNT